MTPYTKRPAWTLDDIAGILTIAEAAAVCRVSPDNIRQAIRDGKLLAFIPGGKDKNHAGRSGYRIHKADLQAWFFGSTP